MSEWIENMDRKEEKNQFVFLVIFIRCDSEWVGGSVSDVSDFGDSNRIFRARELVAMAVILPLDLDCDRGVHQHHGFQP